VAEAQNRLPMSETSTLSGFSGGTAASIA
jgi:hypothetical protein